MDLFLDVQDTILKILRLRLNFAMIHLYMLKQARRQYSPVLGNQSNQPIPLEYKRKVRCNVLRFRCLWVLHHDMHIVVHTIASRNFR